MNEGSVPNNDELKVSESNSSVVNGSEDISDINVPDPNGAPSPPSLRFYDIASVATCLGMGVGLFALLVSRATTCRGATRSSRLLKQQREQQVIADLEAFAKSCSQPFTTGSAKIEP